MKLSDKPYTNILVVQLGSSYRLQPRDIDPKKHMNFGMCEMEETAAAIIRHCQSKGMWISFTRDEIKILLPEMDMQDQDGLDSLVYHHWLMRTGLQRYVLTNIFIDRCYEWAPAGQRQKV